MTLERFFPVMMILLSLAAAIIYGAARDWRKCIYFFAAAVLTATQVF